MGFLGRLSVFQEGHLLGFLRCLSILLRGRMLGFLACLSKNLDSFLRFQDLLWRRTKHGYLDKCFKISRYSPGVILLPMLLSWGLVTGSPQWAAPRLLVGIVVGIVVGAFLLGAMRVSDARRWPVSRDLLMQVGLILVVCAGVWLVGPSECRDYPYQHVVIPLTVTTAAALLVGAWLVRRLTAPPGGRDFAARLRVTELFAVRPPMPQVTLVTLAGSAGTILKTGILYLAWPPAFAALLASPRVIEWLQPAADWINGFIEPHFSLPDP